MQVGGGHGGAELLGQPGGLLVGVRQHHPISGHDHRAASLGQQGRGLVQQGGVAGSALAGTVLVGFQNLLMGFPVEEIAGNVNLHRPQMGHGHPESGPHRFSHPIRTGNLQLKFGDRTENGELFHLLEPVQSNRSRSRRGSDDHHRRVGVIGSGDPGDHIGDPRTVLGGADRGAAGGPSVGVGHMSGVLLMADR